MKQEIENIIKKNLPEKKEGGLPFIMPENMQTPVENALNISGFNQALSQIDTSLIADEVLKVVVEKEIVICSAIRMEDGHIIRGHRHSDCLRTASQIPRYKENSYAWGENQGFVTSKNRYVNRIEGAKLQKEAGIKSKMPEGQEYLHGELYSEDLY